ncbi:predicted protein [Postia placenta Mad-698-R]|nr:predicted protein [Postia placenta Mad-698-R]
MEECSTASDVSALLTDDANDPPRLVVKVERVEVKHVEVVLFEAKAAGPIKRQSHLVEVASLLELRAPLAGARGDWPELTTAINAEVERRFEEQKRLAEEEARRIEEAAKRAKAAEERRLEDERRRKEEEERRLEDERRAQEAADEELARIAAAEGLLSDPAPAGVDKGKGRARVDEEVAELSDDPSIKTPRTVERPLAMTEVDMAAAAIEKRQSGQKFQQGCYFDKVSVLGKTKKTRGGGSTTKKRIRPASPGPSVADASGSKKRRVDEPPRPLLRRPLDGASRLGLDREERAHIARRRVLLHDMDLDLQKMEKDALAKGGIGFVRGVVDED